MRVLLLNLPNKERIVRRYMCSYNAPNFLFPPYELMSLGGIVRSLGGNVLLRDAIAENLQSEDVNSIIIQCKPDLVVSLCGFECFENDVSELELIKRKHPEIKIILFGHYVSVYPQEILDKTNIDFLILGEPELIFSDLYETLVSNGKLSAISGIAYKDNNQIMIQPGARRIPDPNKLPMPAFDLMKIEHYSEPFLPKPFALIQTARGCPFYCNYCVTTYGTKLTVLSPEKVVEQIQYLKDTFHIKSLRFIDDTFSAQPSRALQICKLIVQHQLKIQWTCLTRADMLNPELVSWMKKAGCVRLNIGMESGSQRVLDFYKKGINVEKALANLLLCKRAGLETMGFFMVGMPGESETDFYESVQFAIKAEFDFILVSQLIPYPGTPLYEKFKNDIDFSILPYHNKFKDRSMENLFHEREKEFYRRFYLRKEYVQNALMNHFKKPKQLIKNFIGLVMYLNTKVTSVRKDYV